MRIMMSGMLLIIYQNVVLLHKNVVTESENVVIEKQPLRHQRLQGIGLVSFTQKSPGLAFRLIR